MKIITRWPPQDNSTVKMQNLESRKNWPFRQVYSHRKLQYFRLSEKTPKMMKIITRWPQDNSNVKIHSFGWEICKIGKVAKIAFFDRSAVIEIFNFFDFLESLWKGWKSSPVGLNIFYYSKNIITTWCKLLYKLGTNESTSTYIGLLPKPQTCIHNGEFRARYIGASKIM